MNIFQMMNEITNYIEEHLFDKITLNNLSKITGLNTSVIKSIFPCIAGCGISEYIRNRKLSICVEDLRDGQKIIDIALKYGYSSAESFTRAFKKFHGISPSLVRRKNVQLQLYPRLVLNESLVINPNLSYQLYYQKKYTLYGVENKYKTNEISLYAEDLWKKLKEEYAIFITSDIRYGITERIDSIYSNYYCLIETPHLNFQKKVISTSNYLGIKISSFKAKDISSEIRNCFKNYLKSLHFTAKNTPIIEIYTKDYVELLIPIN